MLSRSLQSKIQIVLLLLPLGACGSSSGKGGAGGMDGTGGAGGIIVGGGTGGAASFRMVEPCADADYVAGSTVVFPNADLSYSPKCLKTSVGDTVTFTGDFTMHPLEGSRRRGDTADSPITTTMTGTSRAVVFATSGFFAYYCAMHGASDDGTGEAGVLWVQ